MDIESLKELKGITEQLYQDGNVPLTYLDDVLKLIDEAIARQTTTCPDCNGSGVYQEYDEYDRYTVHSCATCDGSGEVNRLRKEDRKIDTRTVEVRVEKRWEPCLFEDLRRGWVFQLRESTGELVANADGVTVFEATEAAYDNDGVMTVKCVPATLD